MKIHQDNTEISVDDIQNKITYRITIVDGEQAFDECTDEEALAANDILSSNPDGRFILVPNNEVESFKNRLTTFYTTANINKFNLTNGSQGESVFGIQLQDYMLFLMLDPECGTAIFDDILKEPANGIIDSGYMPHIFTKMYDDEDYGWNTTLFKLMTIAKQQGLVLI